MTEIRVFEVLREESANGLGRLLGWGIEMPNAGCIVDWRLTAFPESQRLSGPHLSTYQTMDDVKQGTQGTINFVGSVSVRSDG